MTAAASGPTGQPAHNAGLPDVTLAPVPDLVLVLPDGLAQDEVLSRVARAVVRYREQMEFKAQFFQQHVERVDKTAEPARYNRLLGQAMAYHETVHHLDESLVKVFDLWDQYDRWPPTVREPSRPGNDQGDHGNHGNHGDSDPHPEKHEGPLDPAAAQANTTPALGVPGPPRREAPDNQPAPLRHWQPAPIHRDRHDHYEVMSVSAASTLEIATFPRLQDAYTAVLRHVSSLPQFTIAARGNAARECLNVSFAITDPRDRMVYLPRRRTNIVFCYAEALWYLWGRNDLEMIGYYAPRLHALSTDGQRLAGTAYGPRLFGAEPACDPFEPSQWQRVMELLTADPDSKRGVMTIFDRVDLDDFDHPDVSCTIALQFLLRQGRLHMVAYLRGNDAVTGLLCDVFSFTLIQEYTARQLRVEVGSYAHHVASMHINDTDIARVSRILADQEQVRFSVPQMPVKPGGVDLAAMRHYEEALRCDHDRLRPADLASTGLSPYWQQVLLLFEVYRQITHYPSTPVQEDTLLALDPGYRWLVGHRWPARMPATFSFPTPSGAPADT